MSEKTKNIPTKFPITLNEEDSAAVLAWMKTRPVSDNFDDSINRLARWAYTVIDEQVWTHVVVTDRHNGKEFIVPVDMDKV